MAAFSAQVLPGEQPPPLETLLPSEALMKVRALVHMRPDEQGWVLLGEVCVGKTLLRHSLVRCLAERCLAEWKVPRRAQREWGKSCPSDKAARAMSLLPRAERLFWGRATSEHGNRCRR
ncbi:MAG TPA: hypothetical protein VKT82_25135 [Ktedonobacterales bacterium]|nr:hypothetical protein [Ktedonobacterales bacterium]